MPVLQTGRKLTLERRSPWHGLSPGWAAMGYLMAPSWTFLFLTSRELTLNPWLEVEGCGKTKQAIWVCNFLPGKLYPSITWWWSFEGKWSYISGRDLIYQTRPQHAGRFPQAVGTTPTGYWGGAGVQRCCCSAQGEPGATMTSCPVSGGIPPNCCASWGDLSYPNLYNNSSFVSCGQ